MVKLVTALVLLLLTPLVVLAEQATIVLSTDSPQVYVGDAIIIDIESTGLLEPLDIEPLKKTAAFDRETYGTRIAVIGGKVVEIKIRRMEFTASDTGMLIFGPLTGIATNSDISSNAVSVTIAEAGDQQWQPSNDDLTLDFKINNDSPFIHQQIVADLVLRHRYPVADETITLPDFSQFDVVPVFEQRRTLDSSDGGWRLISWQWLLHPKTSGELSIDGPQWSGLMVKSRTQRGEFLQPSQSTNLSIQPAINADEWWLPASSIKLEDGWSTPILELDAGDEVIRTVTVTATGVLSQQIPDIAPLASRAISSVLISKQREQTLINNTITSKAEFKFRMTAQSPIPVFLDTIRVPWWNTVENKMSESIIPARRINVGLPERADVLANLALKRTPWERSKLFIRSSGVTWKLPAALLAVLVASYLLLTKSSHVGNLLKRLAQLHHVRKINRAVSKNNWPKVWNLLQNAPAQMQRCEAFQEIQNYSEQMLFGQGSTTPKPLTELPTLRIVNIDKAAEHPPLLNI